VFAAPLAALFATVLAFNQVGDGLRRALDPVMQR
jgi:dipeptide transport system permease protein